MRSIKRPLAIIDITETADYFAQESFDLAVRFIDAVEETIHRIEKLPSLGTPQKFSARPELRMRSVEAFPKILVFYLVDDDVIEIGA